MDGRRRFAICLTTLFIAAIVAPSVYAVIVPDVEGQLYPVAEFAITGLGFAVGEVTPLFDDAPVGTVLGQDPEAYLDLPAGTAIDLTVSAGPCACEDFFEQFLDDATGQIIEQSKFEYGAYWVTQAMDDIDPDHSELDEEYYSYYTWDLNEDGIPDYLALELFAHLLCLPDGYPLASTLGIDVAGIKAQFQQNLDEVNLKMDEIALKYIAIRDAVDDAGVIADDMLASGAGSPLDDLISTDAFTTGVIPPYFVGKTYRDLANKINDGVDEALPEINNGNADTVYHAFVDHEAVNYLIAAMMGMSDDMVHWVLDSDEYQDAYDNLGLTDIDLAYLDALFTFPAAALAEVQGAITLADLHQDDVPTYGTDYDLYMQDTTELLAGQTHLIVR